MKNLIPFVAIVFLALLFTQCKSDDDDSSCICPEIFDPVCGDDGVQYGNPCSAECAGVTYTAGYCPESADGRVRDLGDPAVDGCGWVLELPINNEVMTVRPDVLEDTFKVDSLAVKVDFKQTMETSVCGLGGFIPVVEILGMEQL